ncbi:MAG: hypothetical protein K2P81_14955 [Bacteriovoracaceae bacterium]|nr:hypothetical protein [Bacteriovoracaceae bacterium]
MKLLLLSIALLIPSITQAQIFRIQRLTNVNSTVNDAVDAELLKIQNNINKDIPAAAPGRLMEGMANSQAVSSKGLATDYISHFDKIMVGAGLGLGADLEKDKELDSDLSGAGITGGVQLGLNMSLFADHSFIGLDPKKTSVMFNFFKYNIDKDFDKNNVKADLLSFGVMGSYRWIDQSGNRLFGWDGVRLHTGYQFSSTTLDFTTNLSEPFASVTAGTETIAANTITGNPNATIDTSTHSIPLEISSGVNFLWIMSFYGGVGTDVNFGTAKSKANLNADNTTLNCTGVACGGGTAITVASSANLNEDGKVQPLFLRGFAGVQVNLPFTRIYVHANKVFGTELYSVATGLRLAF